MGTKLVDLEVFVHHETEKAVLITLDGLRSHGVWVPKSAIELEKIEGQNAIAYIGTLPEWLAIEKRLV